MVSSSARSSALLLAVVLYIVCVLLRQQCQEQCIAIICWIYICVCVAENSSARNKVAGVTEKLHSTKVSKC